MANKGIKAPQPVKVQLENQYKPVGIQAIKAATVCKGTAKTAKAGR